MLNTPWQMILVALAGWITRQQLAVIEYLKGDPGQLICGDTAYSLATWSGLRKVGVAS